jgi:hypothetical protein
VRRRDGTGFRVQRSTFSVAEGKRFAGYGDEEVFEGSVVAFLRKGAGIALEKDFSAGKKEDAMADLGDLDHVVGGPEDADPGAFGEFADRGANFAGDGGIERGCGLVKEKQARLIRSTARRMIAILAGYFCCSARDDSLFSFSEIICGAERLFRLALRTA